MRLDPWTVLTSLTLESGATWGDTATGVQLTDARAILDGPQPFHYITRARGYSKSTDLAAIFLALMLTEAPPGARLFWLASDEGQGSLALDSIAGFRSRSALLADSIEVQSRRVLVPDSGVSLTVLPADGPGAWGLRPWAVAVDERAQWAETPAAERLWEAVSTAAAKVPGCRMAIITTAGDPQHPAARILGHARQSPTWRVSETAGPPPWIDATLLAEQRARLPEPVYARLFLNQWTAGTGAFLSAEAVEAAFTLDGPCIRPEPHRSYRAALDLGHVNDRSVLAIGHEEGGGVVLDYMRTWSGSPRNPVSFAEVEEAIIAAHGRFRFTLRADPWQALHVLERLETRGIRAEPFSFTSASKQRLASTLLQLANDRALHLYPAEGLREELLDLRLKTGAAGTWTFDHKGGGHDDRCIALALMAVGALEDRSGAAASINTRPISAADRAISRGGLTLTGSRYLDLAHPSEAPSALPPGWSGSIPADGRGLRAVRRPPPGWSERGRR